MKRIIYCLFLFIALLISSFAFGGTVKQDPKLITGKLANGLTYYIYPNNYPKGEAVFRLFIKSGSVFENENQRGLAHFVEHMAFNGTKTFPGNALIRYLESKGAKFGQDLNAHTSFNETVYKLQLPTNDPGMVDTTMTILADWADGVTFDSTEIESERGVILSEWLSKTGPEQDAQNAFLMELLNKSRFSERLVIGDTAVIKHFPRQRICDYYQHWYHPQLMAVAVAGDVDVHQIKKLILEKFGPVKKVDHDNIPVYPISDYDSVAAKIVVHPSLQKIEYDQIQLLPETAPVVNEQTYRGYLLQVLLNRLMDARMNALSFENPPYAKASVSLSNFLNTKGVLLASVELTPTKIDSGIQTFSSQLEQMYRFGFIPLEIEKAKKSYLNALQRSANVKKPTPSMDYMDQLYACFYKGELLITPKTEYKLAKKYIGSIDSLTLVNFFHKMVKPQQTHYMITAFDRVASELPAEEKVLSMAADIRARAIAPYSKNMTIPEKLLAKEPKASKVAKETAVSQIQAQVLTLSNGATVIFRRSTTPNSPITLTAFRKGGLYALDSTDYVSGLYA
ncbi:MAG: pitrilysin family protein, partial [Bacteroidota bacterium]|nr:pitrilysin family protein [Bacteroidota bacterium]